MDDQGIVEKAELCRQTFATLQVAAEESGLVGTSNPRNIQQLRDRFAQWTDNLGALQPASSPLSLEYRLRKSPVVRAAVGSLLGPLAKLLQSATDIVEGRRSNRTAEPLVFSDQDLAEGEFSSSDSDSDSATSSIASFEIRPQATGPVSEIDELMLTIKHRIDSLFEISIFIRNVDPKDKWQRAATKEPFDNLTDVMYVQDKYRLLASTNATLAARLGKANARRRQYFKYCRDHNDKLSGQVTASLANNNAQEQEPHTSDSAPQLAGPGGEVAESVLTGQTKPSLLAETKATEFIPQQLEDTELSAYLDAQSARSVFSFATPVADTSEDSLVFPPLPSEAKNNTTFLCPYCFTVVALQKRHKTRQWRFVKDDLLDWRSSTKKTSYLRQHILQDLEPYICTFPTCSLMTYHSQHDWFDHEMLTHRSRWKCFGCSEFFESSEALEHHITTRHGQEVTKKQIPAIIDSSRRFPATFLPSECPFCNGEWAKAEPERQPTQETGTVLVVTTDQFRAHLGHHLQQVALFSLPRPIQDQEMASESAVAILDRDSRDMPAGRAWLGRGWRVVFRKRVTLTALASFLDLHERQQHRKFLTRSLIGVDLDDVPEGLKRVEDGWNIVHRSRNSPASGISSMREPDTNHPGYITDLKFSSDGRYVATASEIKIQIFVVSTGQRFRELVTPSRDGRWLALGFDPSSTSLLASGDNGYGKVYVSNFLLIVNDSSHGTITDSNKIWDFKSGELLQALKGHSGSVKSVCWAPDGQTIASGSQDGTVRLWDWNPGTKLATCRSVLSATQALNTVAISCDSELVVAGCYDGRVRLWNMGTGALIACSEGGHTEWINDMVLSQGGGKNPTPFILSTSPDGTIKRWDYTLDHLRCSKTYAGHKDGTYDLAVIPGTDLFVCLTGFDVVFYAADSDLEIAVLGLKSKINSLAVSQPPESDSSVPVTIAVTTASFDLILWDFTQVDQQRD